MVVGRSGSEVEIDTERGALGAYLSLPDGTGPGVLVIHEAWGLVDAIRDVCDRLARDGFVALAPDLFGGRRPESLEEAKEILAGLDPEALARDLEAAAGALQGRFEVDGARIGAVGFCWGGHVALYAATKLARVAAVVDFYGRPSLPLDLSRLEAAVLAIFAERDQVISPEMVEGLRAELEAAGSRYTLTVEPGVQHGFMNDARPERFDAVAARECWERMRAFLRAELA